MSPPGRPKGEYRSAQREGSPVSPPGRPKGEYRSAQREGCPVNAHPRPLPAHRPSRWRSSAACAVAAAAAFAVSAPAQTIYKCRDAGGGVTYSGTACAGEGGTLGNSAQARSRGATLAANAEPAVPSSLTAPVSIPGPRTGLPKRCDNAASLQFVIALLESAATPDDVRGFLAEERLRLVRCEYVRLAAGEWREREQRMHDVEARDAARRQEAIARIDALYDQYLTPAEQAVRMRGRSR